MKIKQAEELVGITSKNIRFYEEQGLLHPERSDNGYREYSQADIETLKKIKLFRKFGVSVEEIKAMLEGKKDIEDCLSHQITLLQKQKNDLLQIESLLKEILEKPITFQTLNTEEWLETMEKMEKEGTSFVNIKKLDIHMKKKLGAMIGAGVVILLALVFIAIMIWTHTQEDIPTGILIYSITIPSIIIIGLVIALKSRLKEIEGGEEDEASKY